ncbi:DnaJ sub C member 30, mitochondrial [Coemansia thaxteri]|uniref:DnaJ sub C member 30, mitochondrial n=1 Tax=Coemansia thaxteri TaxID=2663907 RepID=A0A9W8BMW4_9FUNG|nr:DnaJ sub C member 30, mitochondrial [Coemansia thaxteri]KAJ2008206.1 DnaJ sub C member 30, mitochondrial [Coemansia thaxteri]KAJ2487419.1 DnaJ sub C member 30, mitochondrial [Coemansia sp. RSA 2320]
MRIVHRASFYDVLGVPADATQKDIKAAFYKGSMRWHPDRNQGSNEAHQQFLKISEAYSILGSEPKRTAYDKTLQSRMGGYSGRASGAGAAGRYNNTAFSSSGEYSSTRRTSDYSAHRYSRPESTYAHYSRSGTRAKSNFREWERQHYQEMKDKADNISHHVRQSATKSKYSNSQITIFQFYELVTVFTIVFGVGWAGNQVFRASEGRGNGTS